MAMIYNYTNARGAWTHEVETNTRIERVVQVDTDTNVIQVSRDPAQLDEHGELLTDTIRFRTIYPIYAGSVTPCAFHCYGRIG